jgi:predicted glycogen debranching enzyme
VVIGANVYPLSTFQFAGTFSPTGHQHLVRFINDAAPTWVFELEGVTITRQLLLAERENVLAVRYKVEGNRPVTLQLWPFVALRDFHALRRVHQPHQILFEADGEGIRVEDRQGQAASLWTACAGGRFIERSQWWYRFLYTADLQRGQEGLEDLYTPGYFECPVQPGRSCQLTAATQHASAPNFDALLEQRQRRRATMVAAVGSDADDLTKRLAVAADDFLVERATPGGASSSIVAGYHWFGDWGRDTFIALAGLTLLTGQADKARQVLCTFADAVSNGMVPNRFDDYGGPPHYNSIDASLWFILAADRYVRATGDEETWQRRLVGPARAILQSYHDGTDFQIHADADGLITGGTADTQLTWMDVKFNNQAITPRDGKAVEVNALWLEALHIMAERTRGHDNAAADHYAAEAQRVAASFARAFWYEQGGYLYDCISPTAADASLRPSQVIAIAMPHCPFSRQQRLSVLRVVIEQLLTPVGLRSLAWSDGRYRGRYGGSWESRDRAYHQGTVWTWLMGFFVQAHLMVNDFSPAARQQASAYLEGFNQHLRQAGLGTVSEIFEGDAPHAPRGCIAQAWSVGELIRAKLMIQRGHLL